MFMGRDVPSAACITAFFDLKFFVAFAFSQLFFVIHVFELRCECNGKARFASYM